MELSSAQSSSFFLVDNGSLQPAATLALRRVAAALSRRTGRAIEPVSLLHSSAIAPEALEGKRAEIFEPALRRRHEAGVRSFAVVPLFFGPSGALTDYLPRRIAALAASLPGLQVRVGRPLVDPARPEDDRVARILAEGVRAATPSGSGAAPIVILVDHGSPQRAVTEVRDRVTAQLAQCLGPFAHRVIAASMERREGEEFAFNEPLLERALADPALVEEGRPVIVALLFFSPGRHAGPGGDIEAICDRARAKRPELRIHFTAPVAEHPLLIEILADRVMELDGLAPFD